MTMLARGDAPAQPKSKPAQPLAISGGPKAVTSPYRERWKAAWWKDALRIAKQLRWGITTQALGDGPVAEFERAFAARTGCKHALAVNSGTAALHSALFAVGVGPGDEVVLPSYTWHATASAVLCCGGTPVFCDVDPRTLTADPRDVERRITPKTKALMVVHVWGNPAEMDSIKAVADRHNLPLVEDCSHAHGATYKGKTIGAWGDVGCFSLQGGKAVSAGEGGVAVCNRRDLYGNMLALGHPIRAGAELKADGIDLGNVHLGPKYRPHLLGVLLALSSLAKLDDLNRLRLRNWQILCDELAGCAQVRPVETLPGAQRGGFLEFKLVLQPDAVRGTREEFLKDVQAEGVPASPDRYGGLHRIDALRVGGPLNLGMLRACLATPPERLVHTEALQEQVMTLPAFADVPETFVRQVAAAFRKVAAHRAR